MQHSSPQAATTGATTQTAARGTTLLSDGFTGVVPFGKVRGTVSTGGARRLVTDVGDVLGIRDGALRIRPLPMPGWQKAGLSYDAIERRNGVVLLAHILNADNGGQGYEIHNFVRRLARWALGSETDSLLTRLLRWPFSHRSMGLARMLYVWYRNRHLDARTRTMRENLAVGWFPDGSPADPAATGDAFVVSGADARNGELAVCSNGRRFLVVESLPNVPFYYAVCLRESGAAYYIASGGAVAEAAPYPSFRPVGLMRDATGKTLYPGIHQSAVGESAFNAETSVYRIAVSEVPALGTWYGTAQAADRLSGSGAVDRSVSATGLEWQCRANALQRSPSGAVSTPDGGCALLWPAAPSGLLHAVFERANGDALAGLVWRARDDRNHLRFTIQGGSCRLEEISDGVATLLRDAAVDSLTPSKMNAVQILDDGDAITAIVDGRTVFEAPCRVAGDAAATGAGIVLQGQADAATARDFEAHPRTVSLAGLPSFAPPWNQSGSRTICEEVFAGRHGDITSQRRPSDPTWHRIMGQAAFSLDGDRGLAVVADPEHPVPDRTAYGIDWPDPTFADLSTELVPAGTARGQGHKCRGGLIFWQDRKNYVIINAWIDDSYEGSSTSAFFYFNGFDNIFDAVWTNVDDRLMPGKQAKLRVVCDGMRFRAYLGDQQVLYRAFRDIYPSMGRLAINKVGLVSNWEWGHDTGTRFLSFRALAGESR